MAKFIELTDMENDKILVNVESIRVVSQLDQTTIFVGGVEDCFRVQESYERVKRMIKNAFKLN